MPTLYLIRGLPGSGKSSFARELYAAGIVRAAFEADNFFYNVRGDYNFDPAQLHQAHLKCQNDTEAYLMRGFSVAVSNTSTTEKEVAVYKKLAEKYNAKFVSIITENRHEGKNVHGVPADKLTAMQNRFSIKL